MEAEQFVKINKRLKFRKYRYGFELHEWFQGKDKDGNPKDVWKVSFCPSIRLVCITALHRLDPGDKSIKDIQGLIGVLEKMEGKLMKAIKKWGAKEIGK